MTMITPSYLGETIEYSSLHACRSTLEDPTAAALGPIYFNEIVNDVGPAIDAFEHHDYTKALERSKNALTACDTSPALAWLRANLGAIFELSTRLKPNLDAHKVLDAYAEVTPILKYSDPQPLGQCEFVRGRYGYCDFTPAGKVKWHNGSLNVPDTKLQERTKDWTSQSLLRYVPTEEAVELPLVPDRNDAIRFKFLGKGRSYDVIYLGPRRTSSTAPNAPMPDLTDSAVKYMFLFGAHKSPALFEGYHAEAVHELAQPKIREARFENEEHVEDVIVQRSSGGKAHLIVTDFERTGGLSEPSTIEVKSLKDYQIYFVAHHRILEVVTCLMHREPPK